MSAAAPHFGRVAVIGTGLIGSSLLRVLRRGKMAGELVGCARRAETRSRILELGIVDRAVEDPAKAVADADLVVVAIHLGGYADLAGAIAPHLKPGAIVTDVGSAKQAAIAALGAPAAGPASIWCPAIRSPAPNSPARTPALPSCSRTAGAS